MTAEVRPTASRIRKKRAVNLPQSLEKSLLGYAAAAGAGLIGSTHPAAAEIIYTPSNIPITESFGTVVRTQFDINNDGTPDFVFSAVSYFTQGLGAAYLRISPAQTANEIVAIQLKSQRVTAAALDLGAAVGPSANFQSSPKGLYLGFFGLGSKSLHSGSWLGVETAYLGLKFEASGEVHYGWARIKFTRPGIFQDASIYGYAYESQPNQPIVAGQMSGSSEDESQDSGANTKAAGMTLPAAMNIEMAARIKSLGVLAAGAVIRVNPPNNPAD
jgi:hypothetical protein